MLTFKCVETKGNWWRGAGVGNIRCRQLTFTILLLLLLGIPQQQLFFFFFFIFSYTFWYETFSTGSSFLQEHFGSKQHIFNLNRFSKAIGDELFRTTLLWPVDSKVRNFGNGNRGGAKKNKNEQTEKLIVWCTDLDGFFFCSDNFTGKFSFLFLRRNTPIVKEHRGLTLLTMVRWWLNFLGLGGSHLFVTVVSLHQTKWIILLCP